jgi:chromate transporter
MYGIKPVIIAVVLQALIKLVPGALKSPLLWIVAGAALALFLYGVSELVVLFGGAAVVLAIHAMRRMPALFTAALPHVALSAIAAQTSETSTVSLWRLFLVFFKAGALLYGSGYVLLAFLRNDLVVQLGWLTDQLLLDAIAIGQFTPGPVFTTATFIGYLLAGVPGALVATIGIFLPSFLFVALLARIMPYLRQSQWSAAFLDGINATSLALMAGVTLILGKAAFVDWQTILVGVVAALLLFRFRINSAWLVLAGGGICLLISQ